MTEKTYIPKEIPHRRKTMINEILAQEKVKDAFREAKKNRLVTIATQTRHTQPQKTITDYDLSYRIIQINIMENQ